MKHIKRIFKIFSILCLFNAALFVSCANNTGDVSGENNQTNQNSGTSGGSNESGGNSTGGGKILKTKVAQAALLQAEHPVEAQANQARAEVAQVAVLVHQEAQAAEALAQAGAVNLAVAQAVQTQAVKLKQ